MVMGEMPGNGVAVYWMEILPWTCKGGGGNQDTGSWDPLELIRWRCEYFVKVVEGRTVESEISEVVAGETEHVTKLMEVFWL